VVERGYEGYVAKDETSVYEGGRTRRWRKVKQKEWMVAEDGWRRRISVAQPAPERRAPAYFRPSTVDDGLQLPVGPRLADAALPSTPAVMRRGPIHI
jgi:hypothetical protein